ncbi:Glu/Leu/Phe/Val dehydrogenase family protein [Candidatus Chlamydia sanziniae]|uniref:Leucine dehydrogenase n=1 Tax=Candidatus Chlamydia sanziniae TaxID=1806891 RepID=A0A1A9HVJ2_9CHLA|nr:Glu/Leu/Phe/Val dehydrogenase dimerization domain-containing protein [Candidatus Chlamydia sanziniae]ANH78717.1 Leucine dehydrogenase [Candidatus Chlamydia sanziniae]
MKYHIDFKELKVADYERVIEVSCLEARLHAIIAIHQTAVGPALGGVRAFLYNSFDDACSDVLRLAKGMTYKAVISNTGTGGGKSVIILSKDAPYLTDEMLQAFGQAVNALEGKYICALDLGVSIEAVATIAKETSYICGLPEISGNPSIYTTHGLFLCMQETAQKLWGCPSLRGRKIAIEGIGSVGKRLLQTLFFSGAELYISDIAESTLKTAAHLYGATVVPVEELPTMECDIFSPCARGNTVRLDNVFDFHCQAIVGAANNQLEDSSLGAILHERGIFYAPDYLVNAGGLINVVSAVGQPYAPKATRAKIEQLPHILRNLYAKSEVTGKDLVTLSDLFVEETLAAYVS